MDTPGRSEGVTTSAGPAHPQRIGPYRILDVLGEGGMSVVYLAEQLEPVRRRVALKCIKLGMETDHVVTRFESERQALAVMDHPLIARVLDAGATEDGRPYFVMERVHGVPITDYCDTHRLSTDERVAVFLDACAAIQHAHQKGVVHRDLKPSNILVAVQDGRALVKVIDFGIAKAMGAVLTERTPVTRAGQLLGTPAYMSPEQAGAFGIDVDTRTDVYSLGVLLYELLTGTLPLQLDHVAERDLSTTLRESDVAPPSRRLGTLGETGERIARYHRTDEVTLRRELRGDLDWIVLRAMEKDRTRRYDSVEALAADLRHHLAHEPVLARPPGRLYVFSRFLRRHRAAATAFMLTMLALAAGGSLATVGLLRARAAEQDAREKEQTARQTSAFLVDLFKLADPNEARGNTITAREILDRGAERIRHELADQPDVQSALMNTIGTVYKNLALYESAEQMLLDSLATRKNTFGDEDPRVVAGLISLGELQDVAGDPEAAEHTLREALALARSVEGPASLAAAEAMNDIAHVIGQPRRGEYDAAADLYRQALDIYTREKGPGDRATRAIKTNLAVLLGRLRRPDEAEAMLREALAAARADRGPDHPEVGGICSLLANTLERQRQLTEAEELLRTTYSISRATVGDDHPRTADANRRLALNLMAQGRNREAEPFLREAQRSFNIAYRDTDIDQRAHVAADLGLLLGTLGQVDEGERQLLDAIAMYRRLYDDNSRYVALAQTKLADIILRDGRPQEALPIAEEAHAKLASEPVLLAYAASVQSAALAALGRAEEAEALVPELRPPSRPPAPSERMMMARALELYSGWASRAASDAMKAQLTADEYLPISLR